MQLLEAPVLNAFATVLVVCMGFALLVALAVWLPRPSRQHFWLLFLPLFAFSLLGFATGYIMGDSRESAVSAVLPAVLTLLGGVAIYMVGSKGGQTQITVSSMVIVFVIVLFLGTQFGARQRFDFETAIADPAWLRERDLRLEQNRHAVDVKRLLDYIELLKLKRDLANQENLDLSRFDSALESKAGPNK